MDFSEEETLNSTTSRQRSLSDGTGDSLTLKTIHKGKLYLISLSYKILKTKKNKFVG